MDTARGSSALPGPDSRVTPVNGGGDSDVMHQGGSFGAAETFTFVTTLKLIGRGGTTDYWFRAAFHLTVTPDGVVHITVDSFSERCG